MNNNIVKFNRVNSEPYYWYCELRYYFKPEYQEDYTVKVSDIRHFFDEFVKHLDNLDVKNFRESMLETNEGVVGIYFGLKDTDIMELNNKVTLLLNFHNDFINENGYLLNDGLFDSEYHSLIEGKKHIDYLSKWLSKDNQS